MNDFEKKHIFAALVSALCGKSEEAYDGEDYVGTVEVNSTFGKAGLVEGTFESQRTGLVHAFELTLKAENIEEQTDDNEGYYGA